MRFKSSWSRVLIGLALAAALASSAAAKPLVLEDYQGAARAFREVKKVFRLTPETRGLGARLLRLEASYLRDVREFPRAQQNLRRAIKLCQLAGDRRLEGQTRLARSRLFEAEGSRHEAFRELLAALPLLDPTADCDALFFAFHCAAGFLAELERPHQAQVLLATIERYYGLFGGELLQLRQRGEPRHDHRRRGTCPAGPGDRGGLFSPHLDHALLPALRGRRQHGREGMLERIEEEGPLELCHGPTFRPPGELLEEPLRRDPRRPEDAEEVLAGQ